MCASRRATAGCPVPQSSSCVCPAACERPRHAQERCDVRIAEGDSRLSGALYLAGAEHCALLNDAYAAFAHTNPMHTSVFPSVRRMEREVVAMTAALLGGAPGRHAGPLRVKRFPFQSFFAEGLVRCGNSPLSHNPCYVWSPHTLLTALRS